MINWIENQENGPYLIQTFESCGEFYVNVLFNGEETDHCFTCPDQGSAKILANDLMAQLLKS